jgi:type II secretory pathway component HofQ
MKIKIFFNLFLFAAFCAAPIFAQEASSKQGDTKDFINSLKFIRQKREKVTEDQTRAFCKEDFVGEPINLRIVNADISDILSYITDEYGFDFVIDKSAKVNPVTVTVYDVPWNVALNNILKINDLAIQCNGRFLRIAKVETLLKEMKCELNVDPLKEK